MDIEGISPIEDLSFDVWKREEAIFCTVHLVALASLLLVHTLFAPHFGLPSKPLIGILIASFALRSVQLVWQQGLSRELSHRAYLGLAGASVVFNLLLAFAAAVLTDRSDAQYFVLLVMPVIEAAFRFKLVALLSVGSAAACLNFLWIAMYVSRHGSMRPNEYFEAGSISMIYALTGVLVWMLITNLRRSKTELAKSVSLLRSAQKKLLQEEKLAAVGRLSSSIAHEVRNPVAMISSSLATALRSQLAADERAHMFEIAAVQAARLEKLTNDFLAYAKPRTPTVEISNLSDLVGYIAALASARAAECGVSIRTETSDDLCFGFDSTLLQQALLNVLLNAIEASPAQSEVLLSVREVGEIASIEIANSGTAIPSDAMDRIFEPFFTTKQGGTGLGLAIARNAVRAQGGELIVSHNESGTVIFELTLPMRVAAGGTHA